MLKSRRYLMTDPRLLLDEIGRRAHDASLAGVGDGPLAWAMRHAPNRVVSPLVKDLNSAVAALRAVLELLEGDGSPVFISDFEKAITDALNRDVVLAQDEARRYSEYMRTQPDLGE